LENHERISYVERERVSWEHDLQQSIECHVAVDVQAGGEEIAETVIKKVRLQGCSATHGVVRVYVSCAHDSAILRQRTEDIEVV